jgi:uncharacterized membrane-anchored protein
MPQVVYTYLFYMLVIFASATFSARLIEIRVRRQYYLRKYKPGTAEHERVQKLLNPFWLATSALATILSCLALALNLSANGQVHVFLFVLVFVLIVSGLSFALVPRYLQQMGGPNSKRPR